jgi:16S rRNA (cytosine967-C5)-methyltransferase
VDLPSDDNPKSAAIRHSHPEWLTLMWWDWLGADETRALLAADNEPAELALRVNPLAGVEVDLPGRREDDALIVEGPLDVLAHPLYAAGAITPQSRASQRVARLVDPQPGERVLDLCAAPGGKTTHLAALMGDRGEVVAVERHEQRAAALRVQAERLHASSVRVHVADAAQVAPEQLGGRFDRVLVDPPCSGLGTLRTHPDLRWRATPQGIESLRAEQEAIVAAARGALAPGGRLVYSTCTLSPREEIVGGEVVRTLPHRDATDGFYIAVDDG